MPIFGLFGRKNKSSAAAARERLQILISHERQNRLGPDFLPDLQREILDVVKIYRIQKCNIVVWLRLLEASSICSLLCIHSVPLKYQETV